MCLVMANGVQNQETVPENLRKQLAVAVRSIQWSYAIFWSLSPGQQGVLQWVDGYYNGEIKTRKTVQAMELKADKIGLLRSEQLRELYESLLEEETDEQAQRPSAALSPEDLTDAEWYYLVCMSFVFNPGQGLPGRAFENGQTIWLCDAQYADSKVFSRSLLAKSASIQTVVCFPHFGGVIELGVTDLVTEDLNLIQYIKTSLLDFSKPACSPKSSSTPYHADDDREPICTNLEPELVDTMSLDNFYSASEEVKFDKEITQELPEHFHEESNISSPDDCSNGCEHTNQTEDSFMLEGINGGSSQVQSWHFMDDGLSNCVQGSLNSSDRISQAFASREKLVSSPENHNPNNFGLKELQECNYTKLSSLDLGPQNDVHYRKTVSAVLKSSHPFIENPYFRSSESKSSFGSWRKGEVVDGHLPNTKQKMLKKILFVVPFMHDEFLLKSPKDFNGKDGIWEMRSDDIGFGHVLKEKRKENEKFVVLRSMVPSINKIDKASILNDTIEYLKELEARIEELESCRDVSSESDGKAKHPDMIEQTSDNCDNEKIEKGKKSQINKRKASDIDEMDPILDRVVLKDGLAMDVKISITQQEVFIEMRCPWREYLLVDVMDTINNLQLDAHTVQSSTLDGIFSLTLKSKFRGAATASAGMIQQAFSRVGGKC